MKRILTTIVGLVCAACFLVSFRPSPGVLAASTPGDQNPSPASASISPRQASSTSMSCVNSPAKALVTVRFEGMTELIADMVLTCTGGQILAAGSVIPTADFTLSLSTNVTSRVIDPGSGLSEGMLLIDEPGSGLPTPVPGYGPAAPLNPCMSAQGAGPGGCLEYAQISSGVPIPSSSPTSLTVPPPNVFFGSASANQITFHGIPMLPPSPGSSRIFRITNIRDNAAGTSFSGAGLQTIASVAISGSTLVQNPVVLAGIPQAGLNTAVRNTTDTDNSGTTAFSQCGSSTSPVPVAMLRFGEYFPAAFKTRVVPTLMSNGQSSTGQNIPGAIYSSESGFTFPSFTGGGHVAGLADYGTRLKAVFHHVPAGVRIFVSTTSLTDMSAPTPAPPAPTSTASYAVLVPGESFVGYVSPEAPPPTIRVNGNATGLAELPVLNGTAEAVWEVITTNPDAVEALSFGVWQQVSRTNPRPGTATVNMSFAPTAPGQFSYGDGSSASSSLPVARFADSSIARYLFSITPCVKREPRLPD